MCIFILLFPILNYGGWAASGQILSTELAGDKFLALNNKTGYNYFFVFPGGPSLMSYVDPSLYNSKGSTSLDFTQFINKVDLTKIRNFQYIIISKQGSDRWIYYWNKDPYASWQYTTNGQQTYLIYNNGDLQIFYNYLYYKYLQ